MPTFRVLIVEDNLIQVASRRELLSRLFVSLEEELKKDPRFAGYNGSLAYTLELTTAACVNEARHHFSQASPARPFDLLLLDLGLPEVVGGHEDPQAGLRLLDAVKKGCQARACTVISAFSVYREQIWRAYEADFLAKDITDAELAPRLKSSIKQVLVTLGPEAELIRTLQQQIIGEAPVMRSLLQQLANVIPTQQHVLLLGEPGTGKEKVASCIHQFSSRQQHEFNPINVNQFNENLFETAMFGHEKGAFTGAAQRVRGVFERTRQGTICWTKLAICPLPCKSNSCGCWKSANFSGSAE
jgi:DNA-binding NtrC family response regulator